MAGAMLTGNLPESDPLHENLGFYYQKSVPSLGDLEKHAIS